MVEIGPLVVLRANKVLAEPMGSSRPACSGCSRASAMSWPFRSCVPSLSKPEVAAGEFRLSPASFSSHQSWEAPEGASRQMCLMSYGGPAQETETLDVL